MKPAVRKLMDKRAELRARLTSEVRVTHTHFIRQVRVEATVGKHYGSELVLGDVSAESLQIATDVAFRRLFNVIFVAEKCAMLDIIEAECAP